MTRICKKCLLEEIDEEDYYKKVKKYIEQLDDSIKTEDDEYKGRLLICKECEKLVNGMCRVCGCFVELRAAKKVNYCPDAEKKW